MRVNSLPCGLLDRKMQNRCKAKAAQNAQCVFSEPTLRLTNAADQSPRKITGSVIGIHQPSGTIYGHGVDSKVPARQILLNGPRKGDRIGVSAI